MASKDGPRRKGQPPPGVRGPGGPSRQPTSTPRPQPRGTWASTGQPSDTSALAPTAFRRRVDSLSYPLLQTLHRMPRWLVIIAPGLLLFLGLVLKAPLAWLGGLLLLMVWLFVAWLTLLSWPALSAGQRVFRFIVVLALLGVVVAKFLGWF